MWLLPDRGGTGQLDTHAYLNDLRYGNETKESEQFQRRLDRYRERYLFPDSDTAPADAKEEPNK